jgi:hypothetical protein
VAPRRPSIFVGEAEERAVEERSRCDRLVAETFARRFATPAISSGYRPRGAAAPSPTAHPPLNRDRPLRNGGRNRKDAAALSMLRPQISRNMRRNL